MKFGHNPIAPLKGELTKGCILSSLIPKQLGLLSELAPNAVVIGVLVSPETLGAMIASRITEMEEAARLVGRRLIVLKASTDADIDAAFEAFIRQRAQALLFTPGPFFVMRTDKLVAFAARYALPTMYFRRELVDAGGLVSYASNTAEGYRQMGVYAGRILKGLLGWTGQQCCGAVMRAFDPKQASPMSGSRFLTPLIAEPGRSIAGDRRAMAESGGIE